MENYKELFVSQFLDNYHYAAVIFDASEKCFYNALFEGTQCGGICAYAANQKGKAISVESVRKLAEKSEDSRAEKYVNISEDNWQDLLNR
ncbi:MAG: hypothetical protein IJ017_02890 [Oscillospiraceae bacterium]|nr:hypothetical protein [Oscillospiraceae bacterium]